MIPVIVSPGFFLLLLYLLTAQMLNTDFIYLNGFSRPPDLLFNEFLSRIIFFCNLIIIHRHCVGIFIIAIETELGSIYIVITESNTGIRVTGVKYVLASFKERAYVETNNITAEIKITYNTANNKYISKSDIDNAIATSLKESFMLVAWPVNS